MTWNCQACTYSNIDERSTRCIMCDTSRPLPPIVDLTKSSVSRECPRGSVMESNRSRRRRRLEQSTEIPSNNPRNASATETPKRLKKSGSDAAGNYVGRREGGREDGDDITVNSAPGKINAAGNYVGRSKGRREDGDDIIVDSLPQMTNASGNYVDKSKGGRDDEDDIIVDSSRQRKRSGSDAAGNDVGRNKRGRDDEIDIILYPAPQRKLPLPNNDRDSKGDDTTVFEAGQRRESKLKKRNAVDIKPVGEVDIRHRSNSTVHKPREHLSERNGRTEFSDGCIKDFFNQRKRPSADDLLRQANVVLRQTFKLQSLRPLQESAVMNALQQKSSIVVMATGSGKSLCYQLPALVGGNIDTKVCANNSRVTIVVCPLIALMVDQVGNLYRKGIRTAACLSSTHTAKEKAETLNRLQIQTSARNETKKSLPDDILLTPIQLLYCTPELIETGNFRSILTKLHDSNRLYMFAIDEAHCLSTWGHDFRPAFRKLSWMREAFPNIPVMACTGTATAKVIQDIRDTLRMESDAACIMGTFNRPNLTYEVRFKESLNAVSPLGAILDLVTFVKKQHDAASSNGEPCSGIIYVHKREDCQGVASHIAKATGLSCLAYHAGLKDSEREETQRKWTDGICSIAVATVAFGMGIDLPHVRYVIHWTMAKSLDGFYQESGRGGRDGKPSLSILYYSKDDAEKFSYFIRMNAEREAKKKGKQSQKVDHSLMELEGMVNYCIKPTCKRKYVLGHFGEIIDESSICKKTCDFCMDPKKVERNIRASHCMSVVVNSHRLIRGVGDERKKKGEKYHHDPLADDERLADDYGLEDDYLGNDEGLMGMTDDAGDDDLISSATTKPKGFMKASSVLSKYEAMEYEAMDCQQGKKGGFVNYKTRLLDYPTQYDPDAKRYRAVNIPDHLRSGMPDPLASHKNTPRATEAGLNSSSSYASESERLKAEIEELRKQKEAALSSLSSRGSSQTLPTPSLSFKKKWR